MDNALVMLEKAFTASSGGVEPELIDEALQRYLDFYKAHPADKTIVYPGVWEALDHFAGGGWPMGICTNKPHVMTEIVLDALGMSKYFSVMTAGDQVPHRKPDGRHVTLTLELMCASKVGAIMVGDSATDFMAAKDAGIPAIGVSYGYVHGDDDLQLADTVIGSFSELPSVVQCLQGKTP